MPPYWSGRKGCASVRCEGHLFDIRDNLLAKRKFWGGGGTVIREQIQYCFKSNYSDREQQKYLCTELSRQ